ncbi:MAG: RsmB/NOP family class I SAM-dependent RNA methyltransferase [Myxococcales bacterium]|nr:MAG: RsmB/NOP family class I SAM-dependent RNA methyltransferase [Myxococcales bacterium]
MPPVTKAQLEHAVAILQQVRAGARASSELGQTIAREQLGPGQSEQLSGLVYAALRRERRVVAALRELGTNVTGPHAAKLTVLGAGLLESSPWFELEEARAAWSEVSWQRFAQADAAVLERASGVEKVALLGSLPDFLAQLLHSEYGDVAAPLAASLSEPAPRALRINSLRADVAQAREQLKKEGARTEPGRWGRRTLVLEGAFNPFVTRAFHEGLFELQDEGSQVACELVAPPPRGLVVDACAGAGGKSLAVAAALEGRGKVVGLDVDAHKLAELRRRAKRAGAANVQAVVIEESGDFPPEVQALVGKAERLLIDAPCSGTGVLRRNPEARARLTLAAVDRMVETQKAIVERALPLLAPGGRLVFVTCSLLRAEGEGLLATVADAHPELAPVNLAEIYDRAYVERFARGAPHELRLLPHLHGTDGFFVGVLRKKR